MQTMVAAKSTKARKRDTAKLERLARLLLDEVGDNGFLLVLFNRNRCEESEFEYLSNVTRTDGIAALKELLARETGNYHRGPASRN